MNPDILDQEHIETAARWVAHALEGRGSAKVRLAPGDATEYPIAIVGPGTFWAYGKEREGRTYWVTLMASWGCSYEWAGAPVDPGYAAQKWTNPRAGGAIAEWTGIVMAKFLTALSQALRPDDEHRQRVQGIIGEVHMGGVEDGVEAARPTHGPDLHTYQPGPDDRCRWCDEPRAYERHQRGAEVSPPWSWAPEALRSDRD